MIYSRHSPLFIFLVLLLCGWLQILVQAAPLPLTAELTARRDDPIGVHSQYLRLSERSLIDDSDTEFWEREIDDVSFVSRDAAQNLERRNIFQSIANGFKKAGEAIKGGFQKVGNGIKTAAQKVGQGVKKVAQKVGQGVKTAAQKVGNGVKKVAQKVGNGVKKVAQKVGNGVKKVAQKVGNGVKKVAQKVGNGVKTAAKKVGTFMKDNGAKLGKVVLQGVSTYQSVGSKLVKFVPVIGSPLSKALTVSSTLTGLAADKVPAKLDGGWDKAYDVMGKVKNPFKMIPGAGKVAGDVFDAIRREEEAYYTRDLGHDDDLLLERDFESELFDRELDLFEDEIEARNLCADLDLD